MLPPRRLNVLLWILIFISVPLALILVSVDLVATTWFARHEYALSGFPPSITFDDASRRRFSEATIRFVRGDQNPDVLRELGYGGTPIYIDREVSHLVDVQAVVRVVLSVEKAALGFALLAVVAATLIPSLRLTTLRAVYAGCVSIVISIGLVVLLAATNFNFFFDRFHRVFFDSGTWIFYETDTLIQLYPIRYWVDATWKLGALSLVGAIVIGAVTRWCERWLVRTARS